MITHDRPRIGISSCLLGDRIRYDGGHRRDAFVTDHLDRYVEWISVCPEIEMGLGAPRERMRLSDDASNPLMIALPSETDRTDPMHRFNAGAIQRLHERDIDGYILKKDAPSCGLERVRVYAESGISQRNGRGMFAMALLEAFPQMPIEDEGRLHDFALRESFIERVFAHRRWRVFRAAEPAMRDLIAFHARNKYAILAHRTTAYGELGRLVATGAARPIGDLLDEYETIYKTVLAHHATQGTHVNVLQHLAGYVKKQNDGDDRTELAETIEAFRSRTVPLSVPLLLLRHHLRKHSVTWALEQTYLDPYPEGLALRASV